MRRRSNLSWRHALMRPRGFAAAAALFLLLANPVHASEPEFETPPPTGLVTTPWSITRAGLAQKRVALTIPVPASWNRADDGVSALLEPSPNPGDIGVVVFIGLAADEPDLVSPDGVRGMLDGLFLEPNETARETVEVSAFGKKAEAHLLSYSANFDNHRVAHVLALHLNTGDMVVVAIAGASDDAWGPWRASLREILTTVALENPI